MKLSVSFNCVALFFMYKVNRTTMVLKIMASSTSDTTIPVVKVTGSVMGLSSSLGRGTVVSELVEPFTVLARVAGVAVVAVVTVVAAVVMTIGTKLALASHIILMLSGCG